MTKTRPSATSGLLAPPPGSDLLPEPEIHRRLVRAAGVLDGVDVDGLRDLAARSREEFGAALFTIVGERPELRPHLPVILYETLGATLPDGAAAAAALWLNASSIEAAAAFAMTATSSSSARSPVAKIFPLSARPRF